MKSVFASQAEFLTAGEVSFPTNNMVELVNAFDQYKEESDEWEQEVPFGYAGNRNDLKECIDVLYTAAQYLNKCVGPEKAQALFDAVHANNMAKCIDGKLVKSPAGKILKPEGFDKYGYLQTFEEILSA